MSRPLSILSWEPDGARVAGFSTASRNGGTLVKIELMVTSPWELSDVVRQLAELRGSKPAGGGRG